MLTLIIAIAVVVGALWLFCLVSLAFGMSRLMRRVDERLSFPHTRVWSAGGWKWLVGGSFLMLINVIGVCLGALWYNLRRKPVPAAPPPPNSK